MKLTFGGRSASSGSNWMRVGVVMARALSR
jgi:hypothetical protein